MKGITIILAFLTLAAQSKDGLVESVYSDVTVHKITTIPELDGAMRFHGNITYFNSELKEKVYIKVNDSIVDSTETGTFKFVLKKEIKAPFYITFDYRYGEPAHLHVKAFKANEDYSCSVNIEDYLEETEKPVVYFYAKKDLDVKAVLNVNGKIGFTYPIIQDNVWSFNLKDGNQINIGGKHYSYLFYDTYETPVSAGTDNAEVLYVTTEDVISFLEHKLALEGLNSQESADFICYWAPKMIQHDNLKLYFLSGENYDAISTLKITPKPDAFKRVFMTFEPIQHKVETSVLPILHKTSKRPDFTVIEWGGMEIKNNPIP